MISKSKIQSATKAFFSLAIKAHHWHLATKSYAQHIALGDLYGWAHDTLDSIIEPAMGQGYKHEEMTVATALTHPDKACDEIKKFITGLDDLRGQTKWLDAIVDEAQAYLHQTLYKLENLT